MPFFIALLFLSLAQGTPAADVADWRESFAWYCPVEADLLPGEIIDLPLPWHCLQECTDLRQQLRLVNGDGGQWPFILWIDRTEPMPENLRAPDFVHQPFRYHMLFTSLRADELRVYYGGRPKLGNPNPLSLSSAEQPPVLASRQVELKQRFPAYAPSMGRSLQKPLIQMGIFLGMSLVAIGLLRFRLLGGR